MEMELQIDVGGYSLQKKHHLVLCSWIVFVSGPFCAPNLFLSLVDRLLKVEVGKGAFQIEGKGSVKG